MDYKKYLSVHFGIGATISIGRVIQCLPYMGFLLNLLFLPSTKVLGHYDRLQKDSLRKSNERPLSQNLKFWIKNRPLEKS